MNYRYGARPNVYMWFYQVSQKKNYHSYYNCSCTQQSCCKTPWALGTQWVHRPWATSNSIDLPVSVAVGGVQKLLVTFTLRWRTAAPDPSTTAWLNPMSLGSKIDQPQQKVSVHLGRNRLPTSETPATGSTADASLLRKGSSDVLHRTCALCPVAPWGSDAGCLELCLKIEICRRRWER